MPIRISNVLRASLPADEREGLEDYLWAESGELCSLCRGELNLAADTLVADHDDPLAGGGAASRANLHLAHTSCNSFKRAEPTIEVRPFLQLRRAIEDLGGLVHYGDVLPALKIMPGSTSIIDRGKEIALSFSDGSKRTVPVLTDANRQPPYRYAFVDLPRAAIHNDEQCQPRSIKTVQLWKIYSDIQRNPLHEPPSARWVPGGAKSGGGQLWMFDGQHKTLACWLDGWDRVIAKVYLDLSREETISLVNSIQKTIAKLPLSTFEVTRKMDEETRLKLEKYLKEHEASATEAGFLDWLSPGERAYGRMGYRHALVNGLLQPDELRMMSFVQRAGAPKAKDRPEITETAFKAKVIEPLLYKSPLTEPWLESQILRERESETIVRLLNLFSEHGLEIDHTDPALVERRRRLLYQSALGYIAGLLRRTVGMVVRTSEGREFLEKDPTEDQWAQFAEAVELLVSHPVWSATFDSSKMTDKVRRVSDALSKNQDAAKAFHDVGLTPGYLLGDKLPANWDG